MTSMWVDKVGVLGRGGCAVVSLATLQSCDGRTRRLVAVKSPKNYASSRMIERESSILSDFKGCPEIIQCFGNTLDYVVDNIGYTHQICEICMEYGPYGSLADRIKSGPLPEKQVRAYTKSLLKGLAHIHGKGYVHCDIKPANILVWGPSDVKITDFGLAKLAGHKAGVSREHGIRGTPHYMAPECITRGKYEAPMDIWSLGCTVLEMLTGKPAIVFEDDYASGVAGLLEAIVDGTAGPDVPKILSPAGKNFLNLCFSRQSARRWSAEMLLNHPFVSGSRRGLWSDSQLDVEAFQRIGPRARKARNKGRDADQLDVEAFQRIGPRGRKARNKGRDADQLDVVNNMIVLGI